MNAKFEAEICDFKKKCALLFFFKEIVRVCNTSLKKKKLVNNVKGKTMEDNTIKNPECVPSVQIMHSFLMYSCWSCETELGEKEFKQRIKNKSSNPWL